MASFVLLVEPGRQVSAFPSPFHPTRAVCLESPTPLPCHYLRTLPELGPAPHTPTCRSLLLGAALLPQPFPVRFPGWVCLVGRENLTFIAPMEEASLPCTPSSNSGCVSHRGNVFKGMWVVYSYEECNSSTLWCLWNGLDGNPSVGWKLPVIQFCTWSHSPTDWAKPCTLGLR